MKSKLLFILIAATFCLFTACNEKNTPNDSSTQYVEGDWKWTTKTGYWILHLLEGNGGSGTVEVYDSDRKIDEQYLTHDIMYEYNDDTKEAIGWLWDDSHYEKYNYNVQWFGKDKFALIEDAGTEDEETLGPFVRL